MGLSIDGKIMKTFYKYGVLGAWKGDGGLVVRVEGGHDGDAPVKHHVQHPFFFTSTTFCSILFPCQAEALAAVVSWTAPSKSKCQSREKHDI